MKICVVHPAIGAFVFSLRRGRSTIIGRRGVDADVEFNWDGSISRRHARLWMRDGQVWFEDLGSRNGSWLNGAVIEGRLRVEPGMRIRVGETELVVPDQLEAMEGDEFTDKTTQPYLRPVWSPA
jgi:pSer/pThr/pTyr-binding forkhead associated (FHA) protein